MTTPLPPLPAAVWFAILFGSLVVAVGAVLAVRARFLRPGLYWAALAGLGQVMLGLAAAARDPAGHGGRAAALQLITVVTAILLASLIGPGLSASRESNGSASPERDQVLPAPGAFPLFARGLAWASLVGVPGTVGFHSKVILMRSLLDLDWAWLALLVLLASWAAMWPALGALRPPFPGRPRRASAAAGLVLAALVLALGLYPHWAIVIADWLASIALS